jgi:hypothetical protein
MPAAADQALAQESALPSPDDAEDVDDDESTDAAADDADAVDEDA